MVINTNHIEVNDCRPGLLHTPFHLFSMCLIEANISTTLPSWKCSIQSFSFIFNNHYQQQSPRRSGKRKIYIAIRSFFSESQTVVGRTFQHLRKKMWPGVSEDSIDHVWILVAEVQEPIA